MPTVPRTRAEIDIEKALAAMRARYGGLTEDELDAIADAQAAEDGDASTAEELARAKWVYPATSPADLRALRDRLGLSQAVFARRFGFIIDAIRRYEQGSRIPSGPAATLLRVIAADPDAVTRALWGAPTPTPGD
jgi:putative transcriptional regulator